MSRTSKIVAGIASAMLALTSCAPQAFVVAPEMRGPSKSGLNLAGKSMAIVYLTDDSQRDTTFNASLASGFASRLEDEYFDGQEAVGIFKMPAVMGADYSSKDTLVNLIMDTEKDVVFLLDIPEFGNPTPGDQTRVSGKTASSDSAYASVVNVPFTTKIYVYDSMNKEDKVFAFTGSKTMRPTYYCKAITPKETIANNIWGSIESASNVAGYQAASSFMSTWKQENFYVIYYEGAEAGWDKGASYAYSYKWQEAITVWLKLVNSNNPEKRACAAYNIGLGCFMMGQPTLALEWLDRSDKENPVSLTSHLREKIKEYTGK